MSTTARFSSEVGKQAGPFQAEVTAEKVQAFCSAVGEVSEPQGKAWVAPPTYMTSFRRGEFELFTTLGVQLAQVLHAEQEYHYERPLLSGTEVEFETTLENTMDKKGANGALHFLILITELRGRPAGSSAPFAEIGISRTTVVVRS